MSLIEALCFSKPVIASNVGGISEIILNNQNGYTLNNEEDFFAEKIRYVLGNDKIYQEFSKNLLKYFMKI
ncbi:glycosyltransferase [Chryseobacterium indoltheticum]|uniref:glycosyltransferase n=1 Tax=Chryseobacterium indoltheticum TaxID=254 RepID=UPI003F496C4A